MLEVVGDAWGAEFVREQFKKHGIGYRISDKAKSPLYLEFLPLLNSGRVELRDHPRTVAQICALERRTARAGKDSIDHPPGGHDDLANAVAGVLVLAATGAPMRITAEAMAWARGHGPSRPSGSSAAAMEWSRTPDRGPRLGEFGNPGGRFAGAFGARPVFADDPTYGCGPRERAAKLAAAAETEGEN